MAAKTTKQLLKEAYDASWITTIPNSKNCSGFVKSTANLMGFYLPNKDADGLIAYLENECKANKFVGAWEKASELQDAIDEITHGRLVLVAMTSQDYGANQGHIAVLLSELSGPHKSPLIYGGAQADAARSQGEKNLRQVWKVAKHAKLRYFINRNVVFKY